MDQFLQALFASKHLSDEIVTLTWQPSTSHEVMCYSIEVGSICIMQS